MEKVLKIFKQISTIPRCSGNCNGIIEWLKVWAKDRNYNYINDGQGNIVIQIPASEGREADVGIILQSHVDMVCQKDKNIKFDFNKDSIQLITDGDWLTAKGTTLGADNGIGMAISLLIADDNQISKPSLELLFTSDEEIGLISASKLSSNLLTGKLLINLDSEDDGVFTVGCAAAIRSDIEKTFQLCSVPANFSAVRIKIEGGKGGHSGIDINKNRANSLLELIRFIDFLEMDLFFSEISGGNADNAIPREAECLIFTKDTSKVERKAGDFQEILQNEYSQTDPNLRLTSEVQKTNLPKALSIKDSKRLVDIINLFPNGVYKMIPNLNNKIQTSTNVGILNLTNGRLQVTELTRSTVESETKFVTSKIKILARFLDAKINQNKNYPPWNQDLNNNFLTRACKIYEMKMKRKPEIEITHGGLECAIIGKKYPDLKMISIGPTIVASHSPSEKVFLPSIKNVYGYLTELLKEI